MNVRAPRPDEFPKMAEKGRDFWAATSFRSIPYDTKSMERSFADSLSQGLMFIAEEDGNIWGGIGGGCFPAFFNESYILGSERFWWLDETKRTSRTGLMLIRAFEDGAKKAGCHFLHMMALEASDPERAEFLYTRLGFERSERWYLKAL